MYWYVLVCTKIEFLFRYGMYRYVLVHMIFPDPVQVYMEFQTHIDTLLGGDDANKLPTTGLNLSSHKGH